MTTTATTVKTVHVEFTQARVIKCTAKVDLPDFNLKAGDVFYLVRIRKGEYKVRVMTLLDVMKLDSTTVLARIDNGEQKAYEITLRCSGNHSCDCAATVPCIHIDFAKGAVNKLVAIRKAEKAAQAKEPVSIQERGTLNGNRPFSLLKSA